MPNWCAWHSTYTCAGVALLVAFVPNVQGSYTCLKLGAASGCNSLSEEAHATGSLTTHEIFESMTDPPLTAWADAAGSEIADKCEDRSSCVSLGTGAFWLQTVYSNETHACVP